MLPDGGALYRSLLLDELPYSPATRRARRDDSLLFKILPRETNRVTPGRFFRLRGQTSAGFNRDTEASCDLIVDVPASILVADPHLTTVFAEDLHDCLFGELSWGKAVGAVPFAKRTGRPCHIWRLGPLWRRGRRAELHPIRNDDNNLPRLGTYGQMELDPRSSRGTSTIRLFMRPPQCRASNDLPFSGERRTVAASVTRQRGFRG